MSIQTLCKALLSLEAISQTQEAFADSDEALGALQTKVTRCAWCGFQNAGCFPPVCNDGPYHRRTETHIAAACAALQHQLELLLFY